MDIEILLSAGLTIGCIPLIDLRKPCQNLQFSVIGFAEILSKTTQKGLVKDVLDA